MEQNNRENQIVMAQQAAYEKEKELNEQHQVEMVKLNKELEKVEKELEKVMKNNDKEEMALY